MKKLNVGVLFGGNSVEHDISIITACQIMASLDEKKYNIIPLYLTRLNKIVKTEKFKSQRELYDYGITLREKDEIRLEGKIRANYKEISKADVIVCAFHGKNLESGEIYGYLKTLGIPCTSTNVISSSICQSKTITKMIQKSNGLDYIDYVYFDKIDYYADKDKYIKDAERLSYPLIVKADQLGSSIGITKCKNREELVVGIEDGFKYDKRLLIERYIDDFIEYNCACIKTYDDFIISNVEEIIKDTHKLYSFNDKYDKKVSNKIINDDNEVVFEIKEITKKIVNIIDGYGVMRCDFIYDKKENKLYLNEINSIPGALSYYLFEGLGLFFDELLNKLINGAIKRSYFEKMELSEYKSNVLKYNRLNSEK